MIFRLGMVLGAVAGLASAQTSDLLGAGRVDAEVDSLFSSDIDVIQSRARYEQELGTWTVAGTFGHLHHDIEYRSLDTFPQQLDRQEDTFEAGIEVEKAFGDRFAVLGSASYVDGFPDHRQLWISQYYDLINGGLPGYESADPQSVAFSVGGQWNYHPGYSFLQATVGFSRADIVPGWDGIPDQFGNLALESSDSTLDTYSGSVIWSTVVNPQLRTQQTLRLSQIEGREVRTQLRTEWAWSVTDRLAVRAELGAAHEDPIFESIYGGVTAVLDLTDQWQLTVGGRYYEDTGEISNSENEEFQVSPPPLDSWELSAGLRWQPSDNLQVRLSGAFLNYDFDPVDPVNGRPFTFLYRDRQFGAARVAMTFRF